MNDTNYIWLMRLRLIVAVFLFSIPAFLSLYDTVNNNYIALGTATTEWNNILSENKYEQIFTGYSGKLESIGIYLATYRRINTSDLNLTVRNVSTKKDYSPISIDSSKIKDCSYLILKTNNIELNAKDVYSIVLYSTNAVLGNNFAFGSSKDTNSKDGIYAKLNGNKTDYNMGILIEVNQ